MSNEDDRDLEIIKRRKLLQYYRDYIKSQLKKIESGKPSEDIYSKVKQIFSEEAYKLLLDIREKNKDLSDKILSNILYLVFNGIVGIPIEYELVEYLRRRFTGESGKIYVYKRGEYKELSDLFRSKGD